MANKANADNCQIAYAFVVGSKPDGPIELVGNHTIDAMVNMTTGEHADETDIIHL
eukprot:CAMPEP_0119567690 /NCGR_PEP_ID=MMETSP1352-20130426/36700_1 /TAXON_ID=265584 /ORGANISM="Stauroneis constricta, Strain CCMP1120" /LENGTH=54 /DNA_ID=CAMNT_0007616969 /DNA_START=65 /DNA_END=226 /DNA_ORIENTATION=-